MAASASNPTPSKRSQFSPQSRPSWQESSSSTFAGISYPSTNGTSSTNASSSSSAGSSLSRNPNIYDPAEIRAATNNFLSKPYSSSSSKCWRCSLRGADAIVFQRKFAHKLSSSEIKRRLAVICKSNHTSVVNLLGAAVSGDYIYLVYEFISGANLSSCLRNRTNPNFTVLSTWISRIRVIADVAHALDYIHHKTGLKLSLVHKHMKSSGIMITGEALSAKICHFGAGYLCGEEGKGGSDRSFEGVRGYMSPEFRATGVGSQESDVYAFGVVALEAVSGEEPFKYEFDKSTKDFVRWSVIEGARVALEGRRLRGWVDRRLGDSFPLDVAEKFVRLALDCVDPDPARRPDMSRVAGKLSMLFLASEVWSQQIHVPHSQISVSLAAR